MLSKKLSHLRRTAAACQTYDQRPDSFQHTTYVIVGPGPDDMVLCPQIHPISI